MKKIKKHPNKWYARLNTRHQGSDLSKQKDISFSLDFHLINSALSYSPVTYCILFSLGNLLYLILRTWINNIYDDSFLPR